ncbi:hypothetical protein BZ13_1657 [Francisella philomiragia subsp. philomiragia ATCC 25015]|uniref:YoaK family protein n=1 Tax=Francisella philomiragia TaxID=28110 RepID=UPI0001AF774B|nr:YoaK family protein [Francisella philomiragia]AJI74762.1 hypothetical protein BZ13_1657 [Francisella philomiragia subsp. philomiragia ATCC 25015]EET20160.1 predicted protein [Francisella philomiragia subsp. philomiragia ATCC 25015]MBK2237205.1 DUF1275 domain-containing protein [Francisella philomiragia]
MKNSISQPISWVYLSAVLLPFNGGYINAATLISFLQNSVGYVTGNLTYAGVFLSNGEFLIFARMLILVIFFLLGTVISGLIIKSPHYNQDYSYPTNLLLQLTLVFIAILFLNSHLSYCEYILAMTMGLQNAMTTYYGSAIIRTTHMTGTTTDLGLLIAYKIKNTQIATWKLRLYIILILSFLTGSFVGALAFKIFQGNALYCSILIYSAMIVLYKKNHQTN